MMRRNMATGVSGSKQLRILLFATARQAVGRGEVVADYVPGERLSDLLDRFFKVHPGLGSRESYKIAIDGEMLEESPKKVRLADQREMALLPPYSGG